VLVLNDHKQQSPSGGSIWRFAMQLIFANRTMATARNDRARFIPFGKIFSDVARLSVGFLSVFKGKKRVVRIA
jgi:hypothetical protein